MVFGKLYGKKGYIGYRNMHNLNYLKYIAETGDIVATESSKWVRIFTAESFSHVGIILKEGDKVYVVETHEDAGTTYKILFDEWVQGYERAWLGLLPFELENRRASIESAIRQYMLKPPRSKKYGYLTLPLVWLNQIFSGHKFAHRLNVCSTLVGEFWRAGGWTNEGKLADPGDIATNCEALIKIHAGD